MTSLNELSPDDQKLVTIALSSMKRSGADSCAALRDDTGRNYVGLPIEIDGLGHDALTSVLVVALSSRIRGIEAVVIVGKRPQKESISLYGINFPSARLVMADAQSFELLN